MTTASLGSSTAAVGIVALLVSLVCLGTWPALIRLCTWGEQSDISNNKCLAPQHRHVCHVYLDYSISYVLTSSIPIILSLLNQSSTHGPYNSSFILILVAVGGGILLSGGNLAMTWAVSVFGAPLTTVLAIQASLTVVLGTSLNYLLEPSKTAHPTLLACGVVAFLAAILLATCAQTQYMNHHRNLLYTDTLQSQESNNNDESTYKTDSQHHGGLIALPTIETNELHPTTKSALNRDAESFYSDSHESPQPGETQNHYYHRNANLGLCIAVGGGVCFGFFSPAFNIAVNDTFGNHNNHSNDVGLSVATANLWFSLGFGIFSIVGNLHLMTRYSHVIPQSSIYNYITGESFRQRRLAWLGGIVCALGNVLQFQGGKLAGFATADLVQAFPLVATVWDVVLFGEFQHATFLVLMILVAMYVSYMLGIVLLACSIDY